MVRDKRIGNTKVKNIRVIRKQCGCTRSFQPIHRRSTEAMTIACWVATILSTTPIWFEDTVMRYTVSYGGNRSRLEGMQLAATKYRDQYNPLGMLSVLLAIGTIAFCYSRMVGGIRKLMQKVTMMMMMTTTTTTTKNA